MVLDNDAVFGSVNANRKHYKDAVDTLQRADKAWLARLITRRVPVEQWTLGDSSSSPMILRSLSIFPDGQIHLPCLQTREIEDYALIGDCETAALVCARRLDRLAVLAAF